LVNQKPTLDLGGVGPQLVAGAVVPWIPPFCVENLRFCAKSPPKNRQYFTLTPLVNKAMSASRRAAGRRSAEFFSYRPHSRRWLNSNVRFNEAKKREECPVVC
jgi:hypothetical protein